LALASVTITDVARRAGVSMKTVSRVLNAEPHVRAELRERVLAAASELRYRPRLSARSLAGARAYVVGFLLAADYLRARPFPYLVQAQLGALSACRAAGYHLLVEAVDLAAEDFGAEIEALANGLAVDGLILMPPLCDDARLLDALDREGIACVRIAPATRPARSARVDVDDRGAAEAVTRHLLDLGHRRIAFVGGPPGHSASARRLQGFRDAMAGAGVAVDESLIKPGLFTFPSGYEAAGTLLTSRRPPTAVFASNDLMAFGVIARAHELGLRLPEALSVAGFDDTPAAVMTWPALTTMRQPIERMTALAVEIIIARTSRQPVPHPRPLGCELVVRASTARPAGPG
jgi:LacI family transcriptional regulator